MEQDLDTTTALVDLAEMLKLSLPDDIVDAFFADGDLTVTVQRPSIVKVLKFLRDDANCQFSQLVHL
jgi:NADH-quinone oxidoreductase subunit C